MRIVVCLQILKNIIIQRERMFIMVMVMPYKNEKAKLAKDVAAGGVLILAIGAAIVGLIIFLPKAAEVIGMI